MTIFAVTTYLITPPEKWLKQDVIAQMAEEIHGQPVVAKQ